MGDGAAFSGRDGVADPAQSGPFLQWFEAVSAAAVLIVSVAFTPAGPDDFVGSRRAGVMVLLIVGGAAAAAVIPLNRAGLHTAATFAALVALVTPTRSAHLVNTLMAAVAVVEAGCASHGRRGEIVSAE